MFQKISLLLVIIIAFILGMLSMAVLSVHTNTTDSKAFLQQVFNQASNTEGSAKLYFYPSTTNVALGPNSTYVVLDPGNHQITAAQIELKYNPELIGNVKVSPVSSYNFHDYTVLLNEQDPKNGRISFAVGLTPGKAEIQEKTAIMQIEYDVLKHKSASFKAFSFLEKSQATDKNRNDSVLESTTDLNASFE